MARLCQSRKDGIPAGVAPGYRRHMGAKDSTMLKDSEKRWQKMHGKKGVCQYDLAAASPHAAGASVQANHCVLVRVETGCQRGQGAGPGRAYQGFGHGHSRGFAATAGALKQPNTLPRGDYCHSFLRFHLWKKCAAFTGCVRRQVRRCQSEPAGLQGQKHYRS